eukprot:3089442-Amphidinium_carterae.2
MAAGSTLDICAEGMERIKEAIRADTWVWSNASKAEGLYTSLKSGAQKAGLNTTLAEGQWTQRRLFERNQTDDL